MSAKVLSKAWLFIGPPGVGKGTYAHRMALQYGLLHVSSGNLLRAEVKAKSDIGMKITDMMDRGEFVPDELITKMIFNYIQQEKKPDRGYILDGFPRCVRQATALDNATQDVLHIDHVVNFRQPHEVIVQKLTSRRTCDDCGMVYNYAKIDCAGIKMDPLCPKVEGVCDQCGAKGHLVIRSDDKPEVVEYRLKVYEEQTAPLEQYYTDQQKLVHFDVLGGAKQYLPKLIEKLEKLD